MRINRKQNNYISLLTACCMTFMMTAVIILTTRGLRYDFIKRIQIASITLTFIWTGLLVKLHGKHMYTQRERLIFLVMIGVLCLFFIGRVWYSGYLMNTPLSAINAYEGGIHNDTLFHVSIAQGIKNYGKPSFLVNSDAFFNYHFGSHLLMAIMSEVLNIPLFFCYCYLYPVLFLPLYSYLVFSVTVELRCYLGREERISCFDFFTVMTFFMYILLPEQIQDQLGNWKSSWLISESFLVAAVLTLLFIKLLLWCLNNGLFNNRFFYRLFLIVTVPFFIVASSMSKISFGFFLTAGITYYLFRVHMKEIKYYVLEVYYLLWFSLVFLLPSSIPTAFISNTNFSSVDILNHIKTWVPKGLWGLHIICYFFFSIAVFAYRLKNQTSILNTLKEKKFLLEEILFLICILGSIPGNLFIIRGGSSFYFSSVQQLFATVLIVSYGIPDTLLAWINSKLHPLNRKLCLFLGTCMIWSVVCSSVIDFRMIAEDCRYSAFFQQQVAQSEEGYWAEINYLNEVVNGNERDYYIYVDSDAPIWKRFSNMDSAMYFYPAMTGIVAIGELYYENGQTYYNDGTPYTSGWYKQNPGELKMQLEDAYDKARIDGKKGLIVISKEGVEIINISQGIMQDAI